MPIPRRPNIRPLLALRQSTPADDTHLIHVARIALRDQLKTPMSGRGSRRSKLSERDRRDIADVATGRPLAGVRGVPAGLSCRSYDESPENWLRFVHHIARYGAARPDRRA